MDRRPAIPEWWLGFDPTHNAWTPVPLDPALTPQDAFCGSPLNLAPGWDWKFDSEARRYRAIALRPKTPIPEWTQRFDSKLVAMVAFPIDPKLTPDQAYHADYGSPLRPAPGWKWVFNSRTERLIPAISDEPNRFCERRLFRWHPDQGHYSLVCEDDDDGEEYQDNVYEYDAERLLFKRYQPPLKPVTPPKPRHQTIKPEPETSRRRRFCRRQPDGRYAPIRGDEWNLDRVR